MSISEPVSPTVADWEQNRSIKSDSCADHLLLTKMNATNFRPRRHHDGRSADNVEGVDMRTYEFKRGPIDVCEVILWVICLLVIVFVINEYLDIIEVDRIVKIFGP